MPGPVVSGISGVSVDVLPPLALRYSERHSASTLEPSYAIISIVGAPTVTPEQ